MHDEHQEKHTHHLRASCTSVVEYQNFCLNLSFTGNTYIMALYTLTKLYQGLPAGKYALGAFNVHNMEYTQAVIQAAEIEDAPVILMIGERLIPFAGLDMLSTICLFAARQTNLPVAVALDHGTSADIMDLCIAAGLSVMFDGSRLALEENIRMTREFAQKAHQAGVSIEAEIGHVGGAEDGEQMSADSMTDPQIAAQFVAETGVDALAVAIGNCHGFYRGTPALDIGRLAQIRQLVEVPLVLHGGSNLPDAQVQQAIEQGIKKLNIGTDVKYAFAHTLKTVLNQDPMPFHPPEFLGVARDAVVEVVRQKIRLTRSCGLASCFQRVIE